MVDPMTGEHNSWRSILLPERSSFRFVDFSLCPKLEAALLSKWVSQSPPHLWFQRPLPFTYIGKNSPCLQHFIEVLFKRTSEVYDFVPVASNLESLSASVHSHHGYIRKFDLIAGQIDLRHFFKLEHASEVCCFFFSISLLALFRPFFR
jgi:hypothetical protein